MKKWNGRIPRSVEGAQAAISWLQEWSALTATRLRLTLDAYNSFPFGEGKRAVQQMLEPARDDLYRNLAAISMLCDALSNLVGLMSVLGGEDVSSMASHDGYAILAGQSAPDAAADVPAPARVPL